MRKRKETNTWDEDLQDLTELMEDVANQIAEKIYEESETVMDAKKRLAEFQTDVNWRFNSCQDMAYLVESKLEEKLAKLKI